MSNSGQPQGIIAKLGGLNELIQINKYWISEYLRDRDITDQERDEKLDKIAESCKGLNKEIHDIGIIFKMVNQRLDELNKLLKYRKNYKV